MPTAVASHDNGLSGIDHCIVGVRDLEAARERWAALGFTVTPRGRHVGWATANYCIMFPADYVELLGIVAPGEYSAGLDVALAEQGEGLMRLAFRSTDAETTRGALAGAGLAAEPVRTLSRALEAPTGTVMPEFRLLHPDVAATPGVAAFVCQHLTPNLVWQTQWCAHRNGATGIASYAILAEKPASLAAGWARLFGEAAVKRDRGRLAVETGTARLEFLTRHVLAERFPDVDLAAVRPGGIAGMSIRVEKLGTAAVCLAEAGVACIRTDDGLVVPPEDANGVALAFVESY